MKLTKPQERLLDEIDCYGEMRQRDQVFTIDTGRFTLGVNPVVARSLLAKHAVRMIREEGDARYWVPA